MAPNSMQNLASHTSTNGLFHFVPGKFEAPLNLSPGAWLFLNIMKDVTGIYMKPIQTYQAFKFDFSSYYMSAGTTKDGNKADELIWVDTRALAHGTHNQTHLWRPEDGTKCNGITVKWCDGTCMLGHIFPMVPLFNGFN